MRCRSPRFVAGAFLALLVLVVGAACSSPPDHPELAVQRTDGGSFVILYGDCEDDADLIRVVEVWGDEEREVLVATGEDLVEPSTEGGPTTVFVPRSALPPRLRIEVEGSERFDVTFDPDDVPPVEHQLLVPNAPTNEEVVDLEDFTARCT